MSRDQSVPANYIPQRLCVDVSGEVSHGGMEHRNSRIYKAMKIGLLEAARIGLPSRHFPVVQCQQAEHVDYRGAPHQIDGAYGILRCALGKEGESSAVDHRRAKGERGAF